MTRFLSILALVISCLALYISFLKETKAKQAETVKQLKSHAWVVIGYAAYRFLNSTAKGTSKTQFLWMIELYGAPAET